MKKYCKSTFKTPEKGWCFAMCRLAPGHEGLHTNGKYFWDGKQKITVSFQDSGVEYETTPDAFMTPFMTPLSSSGKDARFSPS